MPEQYFVECSCRRQIRVELFQAGTVQTCPSCKAVVDIPNTTRLKEMSGDPYPTLRLIEKIQRTAERGEPPFDGVCHACSRVDATYAVPITLEAMKERHVADDGGIRPTLTGGIRLVAGASEELWESTTFPLLLCEQCHAQYQATQSAARRMNVARLIGLVVLLLAFLYFAWNNAEAVAALAGLIWLVGAVAWVLRLRDNKKVDPFILKWLSNIRWVPEAIAAEEEFHLKIGPVRSRHDENTARA